MYRQGMLPGVDAPQRLLAGIDRQDDFVPDMDDFGGLVRSDEAIWEDSQGISIFRHPEALLRDDSQLWEVVMIWRAGAIQELTVTDLAERTIFFVSCWSIMRHAQHRELKRMTPGDADG